MYRSLRMTSLVIIGLAFSTMAARADGYEPIVTYYPATPALVAATYYAPQPAYYSPPVVYRSYYTAPVYYAPTVVASAPVVSYAAPIAVSTYRYGVLPRSTVTTYSYAAPVPAVSPYYIPVYR